MSSSMFRATKLLIAVALSYGLALVSAVSAERPDDQND
jgi:hypothetical protein